MDETIRVTVVRTAAAMQAVRDIRHAVFVAEQGIPPELDRDGRDKSAVHVLVWCGASAVATGRMLRVGPQEGQLARIAVLPAFRGRGLGREVVRALEAEARKQGLRRLRLQAHRHLEDFYRNLGYECTGTTARAGTHVVIDMARTLPG